MVGQSGRVNGRAHVFFVANFCLLVWNPDLVYVTKADTLNVMQLENLDRGHQRNNEGTLVILEMQIIRDEQREIDNRHAYGPIIIRVVKYEAPHRLQSDAFRLRWFTKGDGGGKTHDIFTT